MTTRANRRILVLLSLVLALFAAACGGDDGGGGTAEPTSTTGQSTTTAAGDEPVASTTTVTTGSPTFGPVPEGTTLRVADQSQQFTKLLEFSGEGESIPFRIEWSQFNGGPPMLEAFNAGAIDVGWVGELPPITAQAVGLDLVVVAANRNNGNTYKLVARAGSGIETVEDLEGRSVGSSRGTAIATFLGAALDEVGLGFDDVELVDLPVTAGDYIAAFESGGVDAIAVPSAWWYLGIEATGEGVVIRDAAGLTTGQSYVITTSEVLEDPAKEAAIAALINHLVRAQDWATDNQPEWFQRFGVETLGLPADAADKLFGESGPTTYVPIDDEVIARQQDLADRFFALGGIDREVDVAERFDDRFNGVVEAALS